MVAQEPPKRNFQAAQRKQHRRRHDAQAVHAGGLHRGDGGEFGHERADRSAWRAGSPSAEHRVVAGESARQVAGPQRIARHDGERGVAAGDLVRRAHERGHLMAGGEREVLVPPVLPIRAQDEELMVIQDKTGQRGRNVTQPVR